ncbi:hypothetical protein EV2_024440 [Malus domestica]
MGPTPSSLSSSLLRSRAAARTPGPLPGFEGPVRLPQTSMFPSEKKSFTEQMDANDSMEVGEKHENGGNVEDALQSTDDHATVANEQEEEVSDFPLERCMRIVPHDQNGGAFFIAVFHKHSALPGAKQQFLEAFINKKSRKQLSLWLQLLPRKYQC